MPFKAVIFLLIFTCLAGGESSAQIQSEKKSSTGTIRGKVVDIQTRAPIEGVSVLIAESKIGTATDKEGEFILQNIKIGTMILLFRSVAYESIAMPDVVVKPKRTVYVEAELHPAILKLKGMVVRTDYFTAAGEKGGSNVSFSNEEIRRSPGSIGDITRIMRVLPNISKVNDLFNVLLVRGGSAVENGFYLDNIEIPNINHFPLRNSTGGPINLINVDFLKNANFSAGGFPAMYGDHLSSVMDLQSREGNRTEFNGQAALDLAGFSLAGEGPLRKNRGSWLLSLRRSSIDMLAHAFGYKIVPNYSDMQWKVTYDISKSNSLAFVGVAGIDHFDITRDEAIKEDLDWGTWKGYEYSAGVNWRTLWGEHGYANTSISVQAKRLNNIFYWIYRSGPQNDNNSLETAYQFRNVSSWLINKHHYVQFGIDAKYLTCRYDYFSDRQYDPLGGVIPVIKVKARAETYKTGLFISETMRLLRRFSLTMGYRYDYFRYNRHSRISPRYLFEWTISPVLSLDAAYGVYYQTLPLDLLIQFASHRYLKEPEARHYIVGVGYNLTEDTRLRMEGYYKSYRNIPLDPNQPQLYILDEILYCDYPSDHPVLKDEGRAESYGLELTLQKKMASGIYGLASLALSRSRYRDLNGDWRKRVVDNGILCGFEGGYRPNDNWELSLRWIYAGGPPYTPLDEALSRQNAATVLDRHRVNTLNYPAYHSLNVRIDRHFNFHGSNLILYASVWNLYNRRNILSYSWDGDGNCIDENYQLGFLPIVGIKYEF